MSPDNSPTDFSVYDKMTGAVRLSGNAQRSVVPMHAQANEAVTLRWLKGSVEYVDVSSVPARAKPRPVIPAFDKLTIKADSVDAATLVLPDAMTVNVDGIETACEAGPMPFKADSPGTYVIKITHFPYQDFTAIITAT
jgi:hypothetical protein